MLQTEGVKMEWKWLNESTITSGCNEYAIYARGHTDWFRDPIIKDGMLSIPVANAPFYYREITGDFVFRAKVRPNFKYIYDACALMVIEDDVTWCKAAFEKSDFGTTAVVCVVTDGVSDDANGCDICQDYVWLEIARVENVFCVLYSLDGTDFHMVRLFTLNVPETVKVGLEAQSPAGEGGIRYFEEVSLEHRTVGNLRAGI